MSGAIGYVSLAPDDFILQANLAFDATGRAEVPLSLRVPATAGTVVYLQAFRNATGLETTNALELLFSE